MGLLTYTQSLGAFMGRIVKDREERRRELIDTAERLFITRGYAQTAISDIVNEVKVSQGAFYYYFDSKEDVLVAVLEKEIAIMESDFCQIANRNDLDEAVKLNTMINRFISIAASGKKLMGYVHEGMNATLHKKLMKVRPFARIAPVMAEVISKGTCKGRFNVEYPLEVSYLLLMLVSSSLRMFYLHETLSNSSDEEQACKNFPEHMLVALEDLLGRALGTSDYKFILQV
jgi:AcrR family transcriptional regulator